ncbi:MAG: transaldolase family protein [Chlamydiota bacterium]
MELWLDTCNESTIQQAQKLGLLYGITTNPLILAKATTPPLVTLQKLLDLHPGPITAQVTAITAEEMIKQAHKLHRLSSRLIIKIPTSLEGLSAIAHLTKEGISIMATIIYDPFQALCAFQAGANYGALYVGRMEDNAINPFGIIDTLQHYISTNKLPHKVIAASIRSKEQVLECIKRSAAFTIKEDIFASLLKEHPLTLSNIQEFSSALPNDWI